MFFAEKLSPQNFSAKQFEPYQSTDMSLTNRPDSQFCSVLLAHLYRSLLERLFSIGASDFNAPLLIKLSKGLSVKLGTPIELPIFFTPFRRWSLFQFSIICKAFTRLRFKCERDLGACISSETRRTARRVYLAFAQPSLINIYEFFRDELPC